MDLSGILEILQEAGAQKARISGKEIAMLCPFHDERTPSLYVNAEGVFHCFGCEASGSLPKLIAKLREISIDEAIIYLNKKGFTYTPIKDELKPVARALHNALLDNIGAPAREYLKKRKIPQEIIESEDLLIGYADKDFFAGENSSIKTASDFLHGRIVIPQIENGIVKMLTGRAIDGSKPKYLHYPTNIKKPLGYLSGKQPILVEGPFDALRLISYGLPGVAINGSSLSERQIKMLKKFNEVILFPDFDVAGLEGAKRNGLELVRNGILPTVAIPPHDTFPKHQGKDPDSLPKTTVQALVKNPLPFVRFLIEYFDKTTINELYKATKSCDSPHVIYSLRGQLEKYLDIEMKINLRKLQPIAPSIIHQILSGNIDNIINEYPELINPVLTFGFSDEDKSNLGLLVEYSRDASHQ